MAIKTLITSVEFDIAARAHNCQARAAHRISKGDLRMKVKNGRSWDHYCIECAKKIIARDAAKLTELAKMEVAQK